MDNYIIVVSEDVYDEETIDMSHINMLLPETLLKFIIDNYKLLKVKSLIDVYTIELFCANYNNEVLEDNSLISSQTLIMFP